MLLRLNVKGPIKVFNLNPLLKDGMITRLSYILTNNAEGQGLVNTFLSPFTPDLYL